MKDLLKRVINGLRCRYTITKLRIKDGDFLIVRISDDLNKAQIFNNLETILHILEKRKIKDVQIFCVDNTTDLQRLSENEMNRHGWFRLDYTISKLRIKDGSISRDKMRY